MIPCLQYEASIPKREQGIIKKGQDSQEVLTSEPK